MLILFFMAGIVKLTLGPKKGNHELRTENALALFLIES